MGQRAVTIDQITGTAEFQPDAKEARFQTHDLLFKSLKPNMTPDPTWLLKMWWELKKDWKLLYP